MGGLWVSPHECCVRAIETGTDDDAGPWRFLGSHPMVEKTSWMSRIGGTEYTQSGCLARALELDDQVSYEYIKIFDTTIDLLICVSFSRTQICGYC